MAALAADLGVSQTDAPSVSTLASPSVPISRAGVVLRAAYLGLMAALLMWALAAFERVEARHQHDVGIAFFLLLILVTLPCGLIATVVFNLLLTLLSITTGIGVPGWLLMIMMWLVHTATGYLQWFWLLPIVRSRWWNNDAPGSPKAG